MVDINYIPPRSDDRSVSYRKKMSRVVEKDDWEKEDMVQLQLKSAIPGTMKSYYLPGGSLSIDKEGIIFETVWPEDLNLRH